ncbi:MAG: cell division topological specificity factor MinE, partial [Chloroflexota bacterium]
FGRHRESSANTAKERLQVVLVHDRINLPPERLRAMKEDILKVISKYVAVAIEEVDIALEQLDRTKNKIIAEIPFSASLHDDDEVAVPIDNDDDDLYLDDDEQEQPTQAWASIDISDNDDRPVDYGDVDIQPDDGQPVDDQPDDGTKSSSL